MDSGLFSPVETVEEWRQSGSYSSAQNVEVILQPNLNTEESQTPLEDLVLSFVSRLGFVQDESGESMEDEKSKESSSIKDADGKCQMGNLFKDKKKKKKKKSKVGTQSPKQILAFNAAEQKKLDDIKAEIQKNSQERKLFKCSTFPGHVCPDGISNYMESSSAGILQSKGSGESESSFQRSISNFSNANSSVLMRCNSLPPKSALRGKCEELGLGPRPKLHVKWAPDVHDPVSTSVSHTVSRNLYWQYVKRNDHKHHHKGKSSHGDSCKNHEKKHSHKLRHDAEMNLLR
eukprot:c25283_g1_i1 orf=595-1461(-)